MTFVRHYQFRSRDEICCYGVSVSQCYLMDVLSERGPLSMRELGKELSLQLSSVTRAMDGLERRKLVHRRRDPADGRVVRAQLSEAGQRLHDRMTADLVAREEELLASFPEDVREAVVEAMAALSERVAPSGRNAPC
jgi:DNA-binding MarR family transcriptional regulator